MHSVIRRERITDTTQNIERYMVVSINKKEKRDETTVVESAPEDSISMNTHTRILSHTHTHRNPFSFTEEGVEVKTKIIFKSE